MAFGSRCPGQRSLLTMEFANEDTELEKPTSQQSENLGSSFGSITG